MPFTDVLASELAGSEENNNVGVLKALRGLATSDP
jgi:hypothetical protein